MPDPVEIIYDVKGIPELSRALKDVDAALYKELRLGMKAIADHVVGVAQQRMPYRTGTAAASVRPRATAKGAAVAFPRGGDRGNPDYYPWLDFGGSTGRGHVVGQAWSGSIIRDMPKGGRYVYPAIAESRDYIGRTVYDLIEGVAHRAGFETEGF
jgi:hypothetical protein